MANVPMPDSFDLPDDNDTPLPLIVAKRWDFPLAYVGAEDSIYYAVQDWIRGVTNKNDIRDNWGRIKKRHNFEYKRFAYRSTDSKFYKVPFTSELNLIRLLSIFRVRIGHHRLIDIRNFVASYKPEYEYLRTSFKGYNADGEKLLESNFQIELMNSLSKITTYRVCEFHHLPSGKIIDIVLKDSEGIVKWIIECKVNEFEFHKAIGQLVCYSAEITQTAPHTFPLQSVLAIPQECISDYMRRITQWLNLGLWTIVDGVLMDAITDQPVTEIDME